MDATNGKIQSLVFADMDKAFALVSSCGLIARYSLPKFDKDIERRADIKHGDNWSNFRGIDFIKDTKEYISSSGVDETLLLGVVGTDEQNQ